MRKTTPEQKKARQQAHYLLHKHERKFLRAARDIESKPPIKLPHTMKNIERKMLRTGKYIIKIIKKKLSPDRAFIMLTIKNGIKLTAMLTD